MNDGINFFYIFLYQIFIAILFNIKDIKFAKIDIFI